MTDEQRIDSLNELVIQLMNRQRKLEERVLLLEGKPLDAEPNSFPQAPDPESSIPEFHSVMPEAELVSQNAVQTAAVGDPEPAIETKVGLTVVNRIGVITLILGVAFFFKWAVDNEWIGPTGRVLLGLLAGFAALGAADFLFRKSQQVFAQGITGAGLAIIYLSTYAAFGFYHLVPQALAFAFMASITALGYALALRYNSIAIAALGFLGGYATPFLLSNGGDHSWFLLSYILLLDLAAMRLSKEKRWAKLEFLAFIATSLIYIMWFNGGREYRGSLAGTFGALAYYGVFVRSGSPLIMLGGQALAAIEILMVWRDWPGPYFILELGIAGIGLISSLLRFKPRLLGLSFTAFWLCTTISFLISNDASTGAKMTGITAAFLLFLSYDSAWRTMSGKASPTSLQSLFILAANGSVYYALAYSLLNAHYHSWLGLLAVGVSATYVGIAVLQRRQADSSGGIDSKSLLIALGMAMAFVTLAIPIQLAGFHITVAWAIQGTALTWIGIRLNSPKAVFSAAGILGLVALRLAFFDFALDWSNIASVTLIANARFFTFAVSAACAIISARWAASLHRYLALAEYLGGHTILLIGLMLEICMWAQKTTEPTYLLSVETVAISVLIATYALALVALGVVTRTAVNRIAGLALVGFVIVKLYLFDVWQLDRVYRIAAFVALGLLLISTSFLYSRFRPIIDSLLKNDEAPS